MKHNWVQTGCSNKFWDNNNKTHLEIFTCSQCRCIKRISGLFDKKIIYVYSFEGGTNYWGDDPPDCKELAISRFLE
jgi:hypothetical protein